MSETQLTATKSFNLEELMFYRDQYNLGTNSEHRESSANKIMLMMDDLIRVLHEKQE